VKTPGRCPLCGGDLELAFRYEQRPAGETDFGIPPAEYEREFQCCSACGHFVAAHDLDLARIYTGEYAHFTYAADGLPAEFERIMSLEADRSDNAQRVKRIVEWWDANAGRAERTVLDVGSGLGVFPARMKAAGWRATALDPDPEAVDHARTAIGIDAVQANFMEADGLGEFGLVTFNKVLEHVPDPVGMLERARRFLAPRGAVYVEVPDGELAARDPDGSGREEFFVEHLWAFSPASLGLLARRARFSTEQVERLREPSGKYTLFAFLR
jgi:SAM-dependent methyltransferase